MARRRGRSTRRGYLPSAMRRWCRRQWTDHVSRGRREITRGGGCGGYVITLTRLSPNPLRDVFRHPNASITFSQGTLPRLFILIRVLSTPPVHTMHTTTHSHSRSYSSLLPRIPRPYTLRIPPRTLTLHRQEAGGHPPRYHVRVHRALDQRRPRPCRRRGAPYPHRPCFHLLAHLRRLLPRAYTTGCLCCRPVYGY